MAANVPFALNPAQANDDVLDYRTRVGQTVFRSNTCSVYNDEMLFNGVGFQTREMSDGTSVTLSFTVTDANGTVYGPFEAGPGLAIARADFVGRVVRIDVETSTGGNTGAVEIEVYGKPEM